MCHDLCFQDRNNNQGWGDSRAKSTENNFQKQPSRGVLRKRCSENIQQIYRSVISVKLLGKSIEITLRHWCSSVSLLHILRTPFHNNNSGGLLLDFLTLRKQLSSFYYHFTSSLQKDMLVSS